MTASALPPRPDKKKRERMALTRDFKHTVLLRVQREPAFARALLDEAATLFLNGEPGMARLILRGLVNATIGFEELAAMTDTPSKSLHRMLSQMGNPSRQPRRDLRRGAPQAKGRHQAPYGGSRLKGLCALDVYSTTYKALRRMGRAIA